MTFSHDAYWIAYSPTPKSYMLTSLLSSPEPCEKLNPGLESSVGSLNQLKLTALSRRVLLFQLTTGQGEPSGVALWELSVSADTTPRPGCS